MARTYLSQFLGIMREQELRLERMFSRAINQSQRALLSAADGEGIVPTSETRALQVEIGQYIENMFIGTAAGGTRAPFIFMQEQLVTLSPYMSILWRSVEDVTRLAVEQQAVLMERYLPPEFAATLRTVREPVFEMEVVSELNPFAGYESAHTWVDPNGYRLSDRIWNTSNTTRRKIDIFLDESIRKGVDATKMAKELETFLQPGRTLRTRRPYGRDASFDAMRLSRTETTRAHAQAQEKSALANPFVDGLSVVLSGSHPKRDICDTAASLSPFPKDDIPEQYKIPLHPHCLCHYAYSTVKEPKAVAERMNEDVTSGRFSLAQIVGPLAVAAFVKKLLGFDMGSFLA